MSKSRARFAIGSQRTSRKVRPMRRPRLRANIPQSFLWCLAVLRVLGNAMICPRSAPPARVHHVDEHEKCDGLAAKWNFARGLNGTHRGRTATPRRVNFHVPLMVVFGTNTESLKL